MTNLHAQHEIASASRWSALLARLSGRPDTSGAYARLVAAYAEPQRHYHTLTHIAHCLSEFAAAARLAERPDELEAAIWLHDLVYDPRAGDNEAQSARVGGAMLERAGVAAETVRRVAELILATRHAGEPASADGRLLVDIDLAILGQPAEVYDVYERNIRREYAWVPEAAYTAGRAQVLRTFLDRPRLYSTGLFEERYRAQAGVNLARALAALQHSG